MQRLFLLGLPFALTGCNIATVNRVCSVDEGLAVGSPEYQQCYSATVAMREAAQVQAKAQAAANRKALLEVLLIGAAGYGEAVAERNQSQPSSATGYYSLTRQWWDNGKRFCQYTNGSTLNVGTNSCPGTIAQ